MFYGQNSGVHMPTSTNAKRQPALAFDQIDRLLLRGAAPPEINSFAVDAATITSLPPLKADIHGRGKAIAQGAGNMLISTAVSFIPVAGPFIAGAASRAVNGAEQAAKQREMEKHNAAVAHFISAGALSRFAFYHGWLRSERGRELTIVKPDEGLTFILDLANKTVQTIDMRTSPETIEVETATTLPPALVGEPVTVRLPDANVAGLHSRGYRTTATLELKQALSWCAPGRHTVTQVEYVTDLPDPQPREDAPASQTLSDGCRPTSTASYREPGRLVLYRATTIDPDTPKGVTLLFERANVRTLDENSLSLFSVPNDFTKE
jgi:hypothetical protein